MNGQWGPANGVPLDVSTDLCSTHSAWLSLVVTWIFVAWTTEISWTSGSCFQSLNSFLFVSDWWDGTSLARDSTAWLYQFLLPIDWSLLSLLSLSKFTLLSTLWFVIRQAFTCSTLMTKSHNYIFPILLQVDRADCGRGPRSFRNQFGFCLTHDFRVIKGY